MGLSLRLALSFFPLPPPHPTPLHIISCSPCHSIHLASLFLVPHYRSATTVLDIVFVLEPIILLNHYNHKVDIIINNLSCSVIDYLLILFFMSKILHELKSQEGPQTTLLHQTYGFEMMESSTVFFAKTSWHWQHDCFESFTHSPHQTTLFSTSKVKTWKRIILSLINSHLELI